MPAKIIAITQLEEKKLYHICFFSGLYDDYYEIPDFKKLQPFIPHMAIDENKFTEKKFKKVGEEEVYEDEQLRYKNWLTEWNNRQAHYFNVPIDSLIDKVVNQQKDDSNKTE